MEQLTLNEVIDAINGRLENSIMSNSVMTTLFDGVSTDSRKTKKGDLFFALHGPNYDGHQFLNDAIKKGARGVVIDQKINNIEAVLPGEIIEQQKSCTGKIKYLIYVEDTTKALGDLAKYYRKKMPAKIIAITGSNGKTTTKDMVYHLLAKKFSAIKSKASFNNFIGVPLTIFNLDKTCKYGIVEMGTNKFGEIARLSEIAYPDIAVITNIAESHLEGFKDVNGVKKAKAEILENLKPDGVLLVNTDDKSVMDIGNSFNGKLFKFGIEKSADVKASGIKQIHQGWSFIFNGKQRVLLPIPGYYNILNAIAALGIIFALEIKDEDVANAFNDFQLSPMRMEKEVINIAGNVSYKRDMDEERFMLEQENAYVTVINDAYNANPSSMKAVINEFDMMHCGGRRIFASGDMLELGVESERLHFDIGREIGQSLIDILWAIGEMAVFIAKGAVDVGMLKENILYFKTVDDLVNSALHTLKNGDTIMIKGSRGMKLERLVSGIKSLPKTSLNLLMV